MGEANGGSEGRRRGGGGGGGIYNVLECPSGMKGNDEPTHNNGLDFSFWFLGVWVFVWKDILSLHSSAFKRHTQRTNIKFCVTDIFRLLGILRISGTIVPTELSVDWLGLWSLVMLLLLLLLLLPPPPPLLLLPSWLIGDPSSFFFFFLVLFTFLPSTYQSPHPVFFFFFSFNFVK